MGTQGRLHGRFPSLLQMSEHTYRGGELELFARALHWKSYWISVLREYIHGSVLEVGAGIGANTSLLRDRKSTRLNSSHLVISYAVFCLKKKKNKLIEFPLYKKKYKIKEK